MQGMSMPISLSGTFYTVADAAVALNVTVGRIRQLVRDGIIAPVEVDGRSYLIPEAEVKKLTPPSTVGRPRGAKDKNPRT